MIDVIRSEWTKIRSVRSTLWTLAITALLMLGLCVLLTLTSRNQVDGATTALEAAALSLQGTQFAAIALATLGVLVISGEYRTGGIRTSLLAVPVRPKLLAAKVLVFTAIALVVSMVAAFVTVVTGMTILNLGSLGDPGVLRMTYGTGLFLTACGLFGLALGALIRHTPGAIVSAIALMTVLPQLTNAIPGQVGRFVHDNFTTNAGMTLISSPDAGKAWGGYAVYLAWIAVTLVAGTVLLQRRDA
ncbi:ABC transporter permease subunit [Nonomuraea sediminis]|uniref:ABC transporter permease subunit n=1 Tax=Nonomuraea sediminis TaxID=2835864 RepID=UPI001BDC187C|nr:ABC transporter permease subunit [Nonomuraea sediminis]